MGVGRGAWGEVSKVNINVWGGSWRVWSQDKDVYTYPRRSQRPVCVVAYLARRSVWCSQYGDLNMVISIW